MRLYVYLPGSIHIVLRCMQIWAYLHVWELVCEFLTAPLRGGVLAVEWVLELDDMAVPLTQEILLFGVILDQLGQRGKLLASVQVVVVAWVLDLDVGHLIVAPEQEKKNKINKSQLVIMHINGGRFHFKEALSIILFVFFSYTFMHTADFEFKQWTHMQTHTTINY